MLLVEAWLLAPALLAAQEPEIPREHHAWARFAPGSWKLVRVTTETFDSGGKLTGTSITETRTTLKEVGQDGFVLLVENTTEFAGKKIVAQPMPVSQRFDGLQNGKTATSRSLGSEPLSIEGKSYPCRVQQFEVANTATRSLTKTYYCDAVAPFVLKRDATTTDRTTQAVTSKSSLEVVALDMPYKLADETHATAHVKLAQKHLKGSDVTLAVYSMEVPGGVVAHFSKELDLSGRVISRSTLELVDYEVQEDSTGPRDSRRGRRLPRLMHRSGSRVRSASASSG